VQYLKGDLVEGVEAENRDGKTFHAGTCLDEAGRVVTNGGRVLGVTALGSSVHEAQQKTYQRVSEITFQNAEYRTDIGYRAIERELAR
jgi:phosphoribosylamine--glycine ligase